jgi:hypothetical protein
MAVGILLAPIRRYILNNFYVCNIMYLYYVTFMFVPRFDVNEIKAIAIAFSWF